MSPSTYAATGKTAADRAQRVLWQNFFYDYEFRREQSDQKACYLTLKYDLTRQEKTDIQTAIFDRAIHHE